MYSYAEHGSFHGDDCIGRACRYGSEPIEGLTVWGKWDSELYVKHNEDVEGEHGWSHFRSESLLVRSSTPRTRRCMRDVRHADSTKRLYTLPHRHKTLSCNIGIFSAPPPHSLYYRRFHPNCIPNKSADRCLPLTLI